MVALCVCVVLPHVHRTSMLFLSWFLSKERKIIVVINKGQLCVSCRGKSLVVSYCITIELQRSVGQLIDDF